MHGALIFRIVDTGDYLLCSVMTTFPHKRKNFKVFSVYYLVSKMTSLNSLNFCSASKWASYLLREIFALFYANLSVWCKCQDALLKGAKTLPVQVTGVSRLLAVPVFAPYIHRFCQGFLRRISELFLTRNSNEWKSKIAFELTCHIPYLLYLIS